MAENQGNSSHQINQGTGRNFFPRLDFLSNSDIQNEVSEKRQALKMNLGSGSLTFSNSTNSTHSNSTSMSSCPPLPLPLPLPKLPIRPRPAAQQEFLPDKARYYSREKLRMCQSMQSTGKLQLSPDTIYDFTSEDLQDLGEIGRGGFGTVNKMIHRISNTVMAVKRIRSTVDEREQKQLLMDLEVVMKSNECPCIVQFYGALFKEGDCWICMELMDTSLDKFYKFIYERLNERIPESILGKITVATVKALNYLKEKLKIIHRDVKPSNILLDRRGNIKLCDFGISGQLVDSIARTRDAGCRPYMAPERIDPQRARGYDVRSDVWSLGITLMEVATGYFPYPKWNSVFEQLYQVVQGDPPRLSPNENGNRFTMDFVNFVNTCLIKEETQRPKYNKLLEHPFIRKGEEAKIDVAAYVSGVLDSMANNGVTPFTTNQP
ncbi:dual specificity mitogen-activated protein kinase kinase 4 isoform X3 [Neodiprion pinetum]|uniref:mitogen-activated protein kinase kinase n=1 Tax=Neodiprion lecontei TaxID=441921 RepID=A0A6J0BCZ6_NEOLC|nr:dual specificity mitogen-activated protein kinase kinase 4 isoform X5 [Neodiprion lecontei]XP_046428066.1 dual specificity mitogen-activated protein kinase kinase 4 isoform X5 [Neodiprion fabricii]XP_046483749.1 dual specificity mitogen-activated protein kinase kinase 4 isoform X5 [Neodiprion pinetum]XP_046621952.1 dual specificity mitogen-activated protein kinase kinase 4 isoform X5 [Neodiprion virginianus]